VTAEPIGLLVDHKVDHEVADYRAASRVLLALRSNPSFWIGCVGVSAIIAAAVFAPVLAPHNPIEQFRDGLTSRGDPVGPSAKFPLGTDLLGRDELSRLLYGARTSLTVGIIANVLATVLGVSVGSVAAFVGNPRLRLGTGRRAAFGVALPVETVLMRLTDAILAFPVLLLAIALVSIVGASLTLVVGVIAGVLWTTTARIVYSRMLVLREAEFVVAARAVGVPSHRILTHHVLPHLTSIIVVYATLGIASTVLFEATLSFLGVGVPLPTATWGQMISQHVGYYNSDPRVVVLPGLAIMITILAFNLLGDALADALDPHHWR
jgi:peptide/nickel transport system permease protein